MKSIKFISIAFLCTCLLKIDYIYSQSIEILWEHPYGGNGDDRAQDIIQTPDSGYLVVGYTNSFDGDVSESKGFKDYWALKLNSLGEMEWERSYGGSGYDYGSSACLGWDGGYLLAGYAGSADGDVSVSKGGYDCWIVKIDDFGNIEWEKSYGGSFSDKAKKIIRTGDSCYVFAAETVSSDGDVTGLHGVTYFDYWIVKIDGAGNLLWQKTYGSTENEHIHDIKECKDGGFIVTGSTYGNDGDVTSHYGEEDFWVIKLNAAGNLEWEQSLGGSGVDIGQGIVEKENGGFLCVGDTYSNDGMISEFQGGIRDAWVVSLDSVGNLEWEQTYGNDDAEGGDDIIKSSANEFVLCGFSQNTGGDVTANNGASDYWVVAIDSNGTLLWQKSMGGSLEDFAYSVIKSLDGNFVVTGTAASSDFDVTPTYNIFNFWVVKLGVCNTTFYADADGDGYGDITIDSISCFQPIGFVTDSSDCNDEHSLIHPGAEEICNALDDNCNFLIDEDLVFTTYYIDADGDGYGNSLIDSLWCTGILGFVTDSTDCDDTDPEINPGAEEVFNGVDDNCNGLIDEGVEIVNHDSNIVKIFPNPTNGLLFIQWADEKESTFQLINIAGEVILNFKKIFPITTIDVSDYPSGIYLLKTDSGETGLKFMME